MEDNLTVDSDVGALIIMDYLLRSGLERVRLIDRIWKAIEKRRISICYHFEIQLITREEPKLLEKKRLPKNPMNNWRIREEGYYLYNRWNKIRLVVV
ncbi:MAG: hypothetical protein QXV74_03080, partial [Candidatus Bathyarchaeia archaeon]